MEEKKYTQEQVAEILSKSRPYIANSLRLLSLNPDIQKALIDERISDAHARVLAGIKEEREKQRLLEKIINEKLSVREAEKQSRDLRQKKDIFLESALVELEDSLGTKVYTYHSGSQLGDIIEKLLETFR